MVPLFGARKALAPVLAVAATVVLALEELPEEQREVFVMREVLDMPFGEIAEVTSTPENTVKSRMRYALEALRKQLNAYEDYARTLP